MNAQRITAPGERQPFAVRFFNQESPQPISTGRIMVAPELGAILHNVETYNGLGFRERRLRKPVEVGGIKSKFCVEVWQLRDGTESRICQTWHLARIPKGHKTGANFVQWILDQEDKQLSAKAAAESAPLHVEKSSDKPRVELRAKHRAACLKLLRREYPHLFRALETKRTKEETRKAYIADLWARDGKAPAVAALEKLAADSGFTRWLSAALAKPGRKITGAEWALALGWIREKYFAMAPDALRAALNERTGLKLSCEAWRKRADRLGLVSALKPGRPEKHIFTMK
jgi:hypothetical protein